jgi:two-component system nitrate/nitrite response regulator NarL
MFLLPARLRHMLDKKREKEAHLFSLDAGLVSSLRQSAQTQGRPEEEVLSDWANAGQTQVSRDAAAAIKWDSLSEREQEVLALVCLGKRNYEIAGILGIVNETVKTHLQHIFRKFGLRSKKELRLLLQDWDFASWWDNHQI